MHNFLSFLFIYYSIYLANAIGLLTLRNLYIKNWKASDELLVFLNTLLLSELLSLTYGHFTTLLFINLLANVIILFFAKKYFKNYSYSGLNFYIANYAMITVSIIWGFNYLFGLQLSWVTKGVLFSTAPILFITIPFSVLKLLEHYDVLCREKWDRPKDPYPNRISNNSPFVSLHVPTYSEPPEIVISTLNKLSELDYDNFEVVVVDNNTTNPALWLPVKEHCNKLGEKFRFFHVENLTGAKGGALNYALARTNPRATIIGVVDADYHSDPKFIKALIGHFDNPKTGFVQTPHDYREWQNNLYLKMCYWEYKIFFHTTLVSLNERNATLTVGTMCLIRKSALVDAGGWSEWCVTEDSELAIRIHDAGYSSVYIKKSYGKGLIPDTFEKFKKQRYRWTAGPVQELQYHIKHFFGLSKRTSHFTFAQRMHHLHHGSENVIIGLSAPLAVLNLALIISIIVNKEIIAVPVELWLAATVTFLSSTLLRWLISKSIIKAGFWEIIGQIFASKALTHTITYSAFRTLFTGNAVWVRTNKFDSKNSILLALLSTREEILIGTFLTLFIIVSYRTFPHPGLFLMLLIGLSYTAINYFAAPLMSIIGVFSMRKNKSHMLPERAQKPFKIPRLASI